MGKLTSTLGNKPDLRRLKAGVQRKTDGVAQVKMCLNSGADARKQTGDWKRWTQQAGGGRDDEVQGTRAETATHENSRPRYSKREEGTAVLVPGREEHCRLTRLVCIEGCATHVNFLANFALS
ncbi:hypothetical protein CNYM01_01176 [Colletotrichum nymphaeae SA-01]|uniref:Uncharacterized protein n=1 Tax=Colletotrichum nymphaeae SA-01 TaxID=1460502 RepID=A0A135TZ62_9PEZI|nr:hypothetical protein CNYM01_01176 [Colletotrichum nymphaeae SA-01]